MAPQLATVARCTHDWVERYAVLNPDGETVISKRRPYGAKAHNARLCVNCGAWVVLGPYRHRQPQPSGQLKLF